MIELVVTDLDGTLWGADERIHDRTLTALRELERRGTPVLVATGRRPRSAEASLAPSGLRPPAVLLDGAIGRDLRDGRVFHDAAFDPADARSVLTAFAARGLSPCVYAGSDGDAVVVGDLDSAPDFVLAQLDATVDPGGLADLVERERVYAFAAVAGDVGLLAGAAGDVAGTGVATIVRNGVLPVPAITVRPTHTSKWEGVAAYCAKHGIDPGHVLAVGDGENDLELLAEARIACVVSDGCDAALALADHVIGPASEGGWSTVLDLA